MADLTKAEELAVAIRRYLPPPGKCASVPHRKLNELVALVPTPTGAACAPDCRADFGAGLHKSECRT